MTLALTPELLFPKMLAQAQIVAKYMREKVRPRLDGMLNPSARDLVVEGIFFRSLCWMETLARLDRVQDFQAIATCTRVLLETCVDLVFIDHDSSGQLSEKMSDWATSTKFQASEELVKFYSLKGKKVPEEQEPVEIFYDQNKLFVQGLRSKHWNGKHPPRWTGKNLLRDCQTADDLEPVRVPDELGMSLVDFYQTRMRRINWQVHGSGVSILSHAPSPWFYLASATGFQSSSDLAALVSTLTMKALQLNSAVAGIDAERDTLMRERLEAVNDQQGQGPSHS